MTFDPAHAAWCATWVATAESMSADGGKFLRPALPAEPLDPAIGDYAIRAHISLMGFDGVRRYYGILVQHRADAADFILVLHGARSHADIAADSSFFTRPAVAVQGGGHVHPGWHRLFRSAIVMDADGVLPHQTGEDFVGDITALVRAHRDRSASDVDALALSTAPRLTVAAHGVGAAVATLFVAENGGRADTVAPALVYTFGSPMAGDADFGAWYGVIAPQAQRVAIDRDDVPKLPGTTLGYSHAGSEHILTMKDPRKSLRGIHAMKTYRELLG